MRTPRRSQSALQTPLNSILGTEANVRLLRVLTTARNPIAAGELAKRAHLGRTTIYPALNTLEKTGIVEFTGVGAHRQARFRRRHPLAKPLLELFMAEAKRVDELIAALREMFNEISPGPTAAWLEGVADADEQEEGHIGLWIVADPKVVSTITRRLNDTVARIERPYGVHFEIHGITRSELEARARNQMARLSAAIVLNGVPPMALITASHKQSLSAPLMYHSEHDVRARRLAVAIAAKLKWDPTLVRVAQAHIQNRMKTASASERAELQEWSRIFSAMPPRQIQSFLLESGERSQKLRQTLPALGLLTPVERQAVLASTTDEEARAAVLGR